ncbi:hypothetical protein, partial [Mesorhizobium sp.]|uniref:hypothetical protein n=1 Tax=Mesorhizobium sp. TaxID=1871066 RepID=UPI00257F841A
MDSDAFDAGITKRSVSICALMRPGKIESIPRKQKGGRSRLPETSVLKTPYSATAASAALA